MRHITHIGTKACSRHSWHALMRGPGELVFLSCYSRQGGGGAGRGFSKSRPEALDNFSFLSSTMICKLGI